MEDDLTDSARISAPMDAVDKYEYSVQITRWILQAVSLWPHPVDASIFEKIRFDFVIFICYFLIIGVTVPSGLSIFLGSQESFETKLRSFGPFTKWFMGLVIYSCLLVHINDIRVCLQHMKEDWRNIRRIEERTVMLKNAKIGRFIVGFCAVFQHSGVFSYSVARTFDRDILYVGNSTILVRALPFPFYNKIVDAHFSPAYEIVFILQCLSGFVINNVTVATCGLSAVFVMHACGQLKILTFWLENLVDERNEERTSLKQKIANIVEHHLRVLSLVSRTEKIMTAIYFVELLGCTLHICLVGYYVIMDFVHGKNDNAVSYCVVISSVIFNMFVFCYIGEMLSNQGGQIGKSVYMTSWYLLPGKSARELILIIVRSNNVLKITAGKVVQLSLSTFGDKVLVCIIEILPHVTIVYHKSARSRYLWPHVLMMASDSIFYAEQKVICIGLIGLTALVFEICSVKVVKTGVAYLNILRTMLVL